MYIYKYIYICSITSRVDIVRCHVNLSLLPSWKSAIGAGKFPTKLVAPSCDNYIFIDNIQATKEQKTQQNPKCQHFCTQI